MRTISIALLCAAIAGASLLASPVLAQQKTVKACEEEWRANRAANQSKGITLKADVTQCRSGSAAAAPKAAPPAPSAAKTKARPAPAPAPAAQKTVKACEEEWRANRAANQAKGITLKAYVAQCRSGAAVAAPIAPPAAPPRAGTRPAAPPAPSATAPAPATRPTARSTPAPATGAPRGANQYVAEAQAKARCPRDTVVWANLESKIYHFAGYRDYGQTKLGAYMCERDALGQNMRAAKNEKHP
jgi:hypothetical protein